jgi:autotransporter translocation and assembly factor TamB
MDFWGSELSNKIHTLNYEQLTVNQEKETKRLIDYIGLDWHEACLLPQDNKRGVSTASSIQVRQKVYQGSSQKWRKYEPFLNGALDQFL